MNVKPLVALLFLTVFLVFPPGRAGTQEEKQEAGFYIEETRAGFRFVQRFSWEIEEYASFYEVVIQKREASGNWTTSFSEFTGDNFIEVSLSPGSYRYRVRAYDLMEKPAGNPEWVSFEILPALKPVLERFSPRSFPLGETAAEGAVLILTVRGQNLTAAAEFRLVRKSPAPSAEILPLKHDASGKEAVLVFGGGQLSPGTYELVVVNPGGLSGSLGSLEIYPAETMPRFAVSLGYKPLIPLYGGLHELLDTSFFPAGAYGRFSFLPLRTASMGLGLETDISWTRLSSRYTSGVQDYDVSGQYVDLELYGLIQKPLTRRLAARLRLGGGLFSVLGFEKNAPELKADAVNALIPAATAGLTLRLVFFDSFFADLGAEYTHFFSADNSPPGYARPFAGMGFAW